MSDIDARTRFLAALYNGPLLEADVVVVLCGEDAQPRIQVAAGLMARNAAPTCILTGGMEDGYRMKASTALGLLMGEFGLSPNRIQVDDGPMNTWEQAQACAEMANTDQWNRVLLVASAYHVPRAFLTFLKALQSLGIDDRVRLMVVPASQAPWFGKPDGMEATRLDLLESELEKIERYTDHVASYADGLAYLEQWEGK